MTRSRWCARAWAKIELEIESLRDDVSGDDGSARVKGTGRVRDANRLESRCQTPSGYPCRRFAAPRSIRQAAFFSTCALKSASR